MTTLEKFGIPSTIDGILQSKLVNKFRLIVVDTDGNPIEQYLPIALQVRSISEHGVNYGTSNFNIVLIDDIDNHVSSAVESLRQGPFNVAIDYLDGAEQVSRRHLYKDATIEYLTYGTLDYAFSKDCKIEIQLVAREVTITNNPLKSST